MGTKRFHVPKPVIAAVAAVSAIAATGLAVQQTAMAGTNGQRIRLCTSDTTLGLNKVDIKGNNQDGRYTEQTVDVDLNNLDNFGCVQGGDWWWMGAVNLTWHYSFITTQHPYASYVTTCAVPDYWSASWENYACNDDE